VARLTPSAAAIWLIVCFCSRINRAATSFLGGEGGGATAAAVAGASGFEPGQRAFADQLALELGERSEDVKREPPRRSRRVDALSQASEADSALLEPRDRFDQVPQRAAETIELPDDERVALAEMVEAVVELRADVQRPGGGVFEVSLAPGPVKRIELQREILLAGRGARVTDQPHRRIVSETSGEPSARRSVSRQHFETIRGP